MDDRVRIALAETVGTLVLVLGGCGTAVLAGERVGFLGVAIAFGLTLLCMAYAIGGISGCHINPAVTLGMVLGGKTPSRDAPYYVLGQLVGGILGGLIIFGIASGKKGFDVVKSGFASNGYGAHSPGGYNLGAVALAEIVLTAILVFTVLSTTYSKFPGGFGGLAVGLVLTLIHLVSIPVSNTSVNPARSIGVAVFQHTWALRQLWAFIVFPAIGAVVGTLVWRVVGSEPPSPAQDLKPDVRARRGR